MLDHPWKTPRLLAALKAAVPFQVELPASLIESLRVDDIDAADIGNTVRDLSYGGDEGGIMCHMSGPDEKERAFVISLTYVRVPRSMPLAMAIADYQKHRLKKIRKQGPV